MSSGCSTCRRVSPKQNHSAYKNNNDDDFRNRESISVSSAEVDNAAEHANKPETPSEASSSRVVLKEKEKKSGEFDKNQQPKRISLEKTNQCYSRSETPSPMYHITWDGFEESWEPFGQKCLLCDIDLANEPIGEEAYYDHDRDMEDEVFFSPPEVAVLACGHAFHDKCLLFVTPEDQSTDPPCFFCAT